MKSLLKSIKNLELVHWVHILVVILSILLTFTVWDITKQQVREKSQLQFKREYLHIIELVRERMKKYEDALWAGVAMINIQNGQITYKQWHKYSKSLQIDTKYPGINGIGVIHHIQPEQEKRFIEYHSKHQPKFKIHPKHNRGELFPITFIEPIEINKNALGLDIAHEDNRYTAARKAQMTGTAQITGPIILVQDSNKTPGFLFYAPFYKKLYNDPTLDFKNDFLGLVYSPFIMSKLMRGTLNQDTRHVTISISDGNQSIYDENNVSLNNFDPLPLFKTKQSLKIYGRTWDFDIRTDKKFRDKITNIQPTIILAAGIIIDTLLISLFIMLARSRKKALIKANNMLKKHHQSELMKNSFIEASYDGYWEWDALNKKTIFSDKFWLMLGYDNIKNKIYNKNRAIKNLIDRKGKRLLTKTFIKHVKTKGQSPLQCEIMFQHYNGSPAYILIKGKVVDWDKEMKPLKAVGTFIDLTEKRNYIEQLKRTNKELDDFAYIASHDLKEPLRGIHNYSYFLLEDYQSKLDEPGIKKLKTLTKLTTKMTRLLDELLHYSRLRREGLTYTNVDLEELCHSIKETLSPFLECKSIKLTINQLPIIKGEKVLCNQLLSNLITNAVKYNNKPLITIDVGLKYEDEKEYCFYVADNGIGIPPQHQQSVFKIFKRLHGDNEYGGGTGFGLSIVQKIVEQHGGKVWLESSLNLGTTFYFTISKKINYRGEVKYA